MKCIVSSLNLPGGIADTDAGKDRIFEVAR
jgi:hypothetical protein